MTKTLWNASVRREMEGAGKTVRHKKRVTQPASLFLLTTVWGQIACIFLHI